MSVEAWGQTFPDPVVLHEDRDGQMMPFLAQIKEQWDRLKPTGSPEEAELILATTVVKWPDSADPNEINPWTSWCLCGHLYVDHHFGAARTEGKNDPLYECWAKGCDCKYDYLRVHGQIKAQEGKSSQN